MDSNELSKLKNQFINKNGEIYHLISIYGRDDKTFAQITQDPDKEGASEQWLHSNFSEEFQSVDEYFKTTFSEDLEWFFTKNFKKEDGPIVRPYEVSHNIDMPGFFSVTFYPAGGGHLFKMPVKEFVETHAYYKHTSELTPALFSIDADERKYAGVHFADRRWNGWAVPYFPEETVKQIVGVDQGLTLDLENLTIHDENDEYPHELDAIEYNGQKYYAFDGWCWDLMDDEDEAPESDNGPR